MRKMLLGIYLALMGIASLILILENGSEFWIIPTIVFFGCSAYSVIDGYFTWGPKARADEEEHDDPGLPPQYK